MIVAVRIPVRAPCKKLLDLKGRDTKENDV